MYREPWSSSWTIVKACAIDAGEALAHAVAWADFQCELDGSELDSRILAGIRQAFQLAGLPAAQPAEPNMTRSLLPAARGVLRWLHGSD
jgi:hypothetical protein